MHIHPLSVFANANALNSLVIGSQKPLSTDHVRTGALYFLPLSNSSSGSVDEDKAELGLLHTWRGYSCNVTPERLFLPRPVLQVALGSRHGVLLLEGMCLSNHVYLVRSRIKMWSM